MSITLPRWLRRGWIMFNTPPIDVIAPLDYPIEKEIALLRGLTEIRYATRDNLTFMEAHPAFIARRAQKAAQR